MAETKKQQKLKSIIIDLNSTDAKKISKAIKALEIHGDATVIKPIAQRLLSPLTDQNKSELIELLSSLKDTSTVVEVMDLLSESEFLPIRQILLSTIWNMKVDFSDYIDDFVEIAVQGDFLEALECLTIIENLEGPFMEESILECQLHLKNYIEKSTSRDDQKAHILSEIAIIIKDINMGLMD